MPRIILVCLFFALFLTAGCVGQPLFFPPALPPAVATPYATPADGEDAPVLRIGETDIHAEDIRFQAKTVSVEMLKLANTMDALTNAHGAEPNMYADRLRAELQDRELIANAAFTRAARKALVENEARVRGIEVDQSQVESELLTQFEYYGNAILVPLASSDPHSSEPTPTPAESMAVFEELLSGVGLTLDDWTLQIANDHLRAQVSAAIGMEMLPADLPALKVNEILLYTPPNQEATEAMETIRQRIISGETIEEILDGESPPIQVHMVYPLKTVVPGIGEPEWDAAVFGLAAGQVSEVISDITGLRLVQVVGDSSIEELSDFDLKILTDKLFQSWIDTGMKNIEWPSLKQAIEIIYPQ